MNFDEIYELAIWIDSTAREYGTTATKVTDLYKAISGNHTAEETKNIIEKEFTLGEGDRNGRENGTHNKENTEGLRNCNGKWSSSQRCDGTTI